MTKHDGYWQRWRSSTHFEFGMRNAELRTVLGRVMLFGTEKFFLLCRRSRLTWRWAQMGFILLLGLGLGLASCSELSTASADSPLETSPESPPESVAESPLPTSQREAQHLPIEAHLYLGDRPEPILLEVARTPRQQALGLMHRDRDSLPDNQGMFFPFERVRRAQFWMKNVRFSLDMLFIQRGKVVAIAANVPPCVIEPCPVYGPNTPVAGVIELAGGRAERLKIEVGDAIQIEFLPEAAQPSQ
ncbi:MAG: DUF192 domain-containing protein [Cyanobacteria bacterium P01_G01_bin.54]